MRILTLLLLVPAGLFGQAVLEDFSSMRTNGIDTDLWARNCNYLQEVTLEDGMLKIHVTG